MKNELRPAPQVTIRRCPAHLWDDAARLAMYGAKQYGDWPNSDCVVSNAFGVWYWKCTSAGNVTVEYITEATKEDT